MSSFTRTAKLRRCRKVYAEACASLDAAWSCETDAEIAFKLERKARWARRLLTLLPEDDPEADKVALDELRSLELFLRLTSSLASA